MVNYYQILGLTEDATQVEIRSAFRKLAVKYHPDKHPNRPEMDEKFKQINTAHQILTNEYEKARFDLKLKYQRFAQTQSQQTTYPTHRTPHQYKHRPYHPPPKVTQKQNIVATLYAFGITLLIALIVMSSVWGKQYYDAQEREALKKERRNTYKEARVLFDNEQYKQAFELMNSLRFFGQDEQDMRYFKQNMLQEVVAKGDSYYESGDLARSIRLYALVQDYFTDVPYHEVREKLADAYNRAGQPKKALEILEDFLLEEYEIIHSLVKIASIQKKQLNNPHEALDNLLTAHRLAIKRYKTFFGEGYALVIHEKYLPESHYYLYRDLANAYLDLDDTQMAIKAADWNKYVWPDSADAYITTARAYLSENRKTKACQEYLAARERNYPQRETKFCN